MTRTNAVEEPKDITAAEGLGQLVRSYVAGSATRAKLTAADTATLEKIKAAVDDGGSDIVSAQFDTSTTGDTQAVKRLIVLATKFYTVNIAPMKVDVGGLSFEKPAIADEYFREEIVKLGAQLIESIDAYVNSRRGRIADEANRQREADTRLAEAKNVAVLGDAVRLFEAAYSIRTAHPDWGYVGSFCESSGDSIGYAIQTSQELGVVKKDQFSKFDLIGTIRRHVVAAHESQKAKKAATSTKRERNSAA